MRVLVFGETGQVALALKRLTQAAPRGRYQPVFLPRAHADLMDPAACARAIRATRPEAVINAAAYTAVDAAESDETAASVVNGAAPAAMAQTCAAQGIPLVHISTDYVFDGTGNTPFTPDHPTAPINAYGRSKLTGEEGVITAQGIHAVLRTSWVVSGDGANFIKTMCRLGATRDTLSVVADQIGGPTPAEAIAAACLSIAEQLRETPKKSGVYHLSGTPDTSWADFARAIMQAAALPCTVTEIPSSAYPTPAPRPLNSRLDCRSLAETFGIPRPDWRAALPQIIADLKAKG
ncbi:dTDP-4-dehydrorhamnose reductase [Pararhodobacter oceanensis]|uniref:dTDP-4-dehydrorhamnose reductase n=1 Tax=Pararhodobacter oceanensis TaxID=2172121 RepID=UPI003A9103E9